MNDKLQDLPPQYFELKSVKMKHGTAYYQRKI
jgi:hypothetical protein